MGIMTLRKPVLYLISIFIPPFIIFSLVSYYGVAVPFWDQWELVPLLQKLQEGKISFIDLWQQHNEHRIFFPKLVMLGLAWLSNWNIMLELYTNVFLAGLILFFLWLLLRRTLYGCNFKTFWLLSLISSCLVFSPTQWENWTWGWQIQIYLSVLATVISVWAVTGWPGQFKGLLISLLSAVVASYSFSNGLLTWIPVGILLIFQKERKWLFIVLWILAFSIVVIAYFYGYTKPAGHPSLISLLKHPSDFIRYMLAYIGSPLGIGQKDLSVAISLFLTVLLVIGTINIWKSHKEEFHEILPWLALSFYSFLSAAVTSIGRVGFGVEQALSSRYTTISMLFIIATSVVVIFWISLYLRNNGRLTTKWVVVISSVSTLIVMSYILTYSKGIESFKSYSEKVAMASFWFEDVNNAPDDILKNLYPDAGIVRERTKILQKIGILKTISAYKNVEGGTMVIDMINGQLYAQSGEKIMVHTKKNKEITLNGWGVDDKNYNAGRRAYLIFRNATDEIKIPAGREARPDVVEHFKQRGYKQSGWSSKISATVFKEGCYNLSIVLFRSNNKEYFDLPADKQVCFQ